MTHPDILAHAAAVLNVVAGAALLAGCASFHTVSSSVATYGTWPADMAPGTYTFDRLPSQQANLQRQQSLEAAAAQALGSAGFRPAAEGDKASVTVQLGARIERYEVSPWNDPYWGYWGVGFHHHGYPGWYGPGWYGPGWYGPGYGQAMVATATGAAIRIRRTTTSARWRC